MKPRNDLAVWGAVTALSFAAFTTLAADKDRTTTESQNPTRITTSEQRTDKKLGGVERANKLIGKTVISSDNQKLGRIENIVVDLESGRVLYAVIGTGPLGIGGHDYAVAPGMFTKTEGDNLHINMDKQKFTGAPEFTKDIDKPEQLNQASFVHRVHEYFGQPAWWQGDKTAADTGSFHNVHKAKDAIGMKVKNVQDQDLGRVDNLMVDLPAGRVAYVILNPDSSLNLGNDFLALPPMAFTSSSDRKYLVSDLNRDKLAAAPKFDKNQWSNLSDTGYASKVYQYYGKQAWFETGGALRPTGRDNDKVYPK